MTSSDRERLYLPAQSEYVPTEGSSARGDLPVDDEIKRYIAQEFPFLEDKYTVYSVPKHPIQRTEHQANQAECHVFSCLKGLDIPGLWLVFFQGRSYGGKSFRKERHGKLMMREHDFVFFTSYKVFFNTHELKALVIMFVLSNGMVNAGYATGNKHVTLVEVKSTCDTSYNGMQSSDAKGIKNSKRSAQHQLRDHVELLEASTEMGGDLSRNLNCYIFWPFLSSMTKDPQNNAIVRWKEDGKLHVFSNTLEAPPKFQQWFQEEMLQNGKSVSAEHWDILLRRFIILSCGAYVDEIHYGMLALLSQEQVDLLNRQPTNKPLIIHGAAGTGKTMLILRKLQQLHEEGRLHKDARALYVCYWPGIRCDVVQKLETLGISDFVDTERFFISIDRFLKGNNNCYKHVFMDESEAICMSFEENTITLTFQELLKRYCMGNSNGSTDEPGVIWFLVDINQASLFLPKHSPNILKTPDVILTKVVRSTGTIYRAFRQFYQDPFPRMPAVVKLEAYQNLQGITLAHNVSGPPIYWVNSNSQKSRSQVLVSVILDLCSTKGIKPNDLCVLPFFVNSNYTADVINNEIEKHFVEKAFMPQALANVESFLMTKQPYHFLVPWFLRVKGLEFKVVVIAIDDDDFDFGDAEDRRKVYIMVSRCTCLLVLLSSEAIKNCIDKDNIIKDYPFSMKLP